MTDQTPPARPDNQFSMGYTLNEHVLRFTAFAPRGSPHGIRRDIIALHDPGLPDEVLLSQQYAMVFADFAMNAARFFSQQAIVPEEPKTSLIVDAVGRAITDEPPELVLPMSAAPRRVQ